MTRARDSTHACAGHMSFLIALILVPAATALIGVALLVHSIRGRLIPGTTLCRACKFDLSGLQSALSCPECGASLAATRAIVPLRVRPRGLLWLGILLTAIPLCIGITVAVVTATNFNLDSIKPFWVLKSEALQGAPARSAAALTELGKRIRSGSISEHQFTSLASAAITLRRTPSATWNRSWSEIIELARTNGKVTDAEWTDYIRNTIVLVDRHRRKVRQGAEAPFGLTISGPLLGITPGPLAAAKIRYGITRVTINTKEFFHNDDLSGGATISGNGTTGTTRQIKMDAPIGKAQMKLTCGFEVLDAGNDRTLGSWSSDSTDEIEILPPDAVIVETREDAALAPAVRKSLRIAPFERQSGYLSLMVNAANPPANLAFDVFARLRSGPKKGALVPIGSISFEKSSNGGYGIGSDSKDLLDAESVDLILRPSVRAAELNVDLDWIWTGPEIVYDDIKIKPAAP
ncbi:MAG: hypothetical protein JNK16_11660 [Phycisphaerales bacterium]|nr:hypothetical protein [Phycisphaerales bacterium]